MQAPEKLFVGSEEDIAPFCFKRGADVTKSRCGGIRWLRLGAFKGLGQKFVDAWDATGPTLLYNAGIAGGARSVYLRFLAQMIEVLNSTELSCRQAWETGKRGRKQCNSNMAVFNYVIRTQYTTDGIFTGYPLHSQFMKYQKPNETDADIIHK
eukprot:TRINITY_DN41479_c0_g1_i1.p3 TRINITY_DN41479_c0_g1~~TRINITY_DN41479_c0_g1_i1.p3  ORF type:complete len:153 (-),score=30.53 TRINITY_DN41479_c0_g1_i1:678-1136(-)